MKSKEEMIKKFTDDPFTGSLNQKQAERCFEIADEYAKQEAIAFFTFTENYDSDIVQYSTEQLYNLYLESKNKKYDSE